MAAEPTTDREREREEGEAENDAVGQPAPGAIDESEFVNPADLAVQRDGEGNVLPITAQAGQFGKVRVRPMTYGDVQARFGDGTSFDFDSKDVAEILDNYIIAPDLSEASPTGRVDADYVESMYPMAPRDLLMAVLEASGVEADVEAQAGGGANVEVSGN